jgi:integrase
MGAKVRRVRGKWTVVLHRNGKREHRTIGPTKTDKRRAETIADRLDAALTLGAYGLVSEAPEVLRCDEELAHWLRLRKPTFKATTAKLFEGLVSNHLAPHFGPKDMRSIRESDLLAFVATMQAKGRAPNTIRNALSLLRNVYNALIRDERISKNPAAHLGRIMRGVENATAKETTVRDAWTHSEARKLLEIAIEHEPQFATFLTLLFATGMRRGEALGLQWADTDLDARRITVRRSVTSQGVSSPKSGKSRRVVMTDSLASSLFELLGERQSQRIARGWRDTPVWVFCSEVGTMPEPRNVVRVWGRVRRRATKLGVRPLPLHSARHSWATWAIQAGKNIRWVADQLGHADASTTLNHYAHAMPEDDQDLSFAELDGAKRHYTALADDEISEKGGNYAELLERETGFEPATLSLGS